MTLGERISALRKERGMSQETLGELVGVSRQAVSKWESDRAVPDVNNCIAMSRCLEVSLNGLLGLEETEEPELTEDQLRLVERLTEQYAAAQKRLRRRWRWPAILLCCALAVGTAWLWEWLDGMNHTIDHLSGELAGLRGEIISGVGDRVEESLAAESSLVSEYVIGVAAADVLAETVTFDVSVTLKEGDDGTAVSFAADGPAGLEITPAERQAGLRYTARVTCPMADEPAIHLLVERDGVSRSQRFAAESYRSDYALRLSGDVRWAALAQSGLADGAIEPVQVFAFHDAGPGLPEPLALTALELCIFRNDTILRQIPLDLGEGHTGSLGDWSFSAEEDIPVGALPEAREGDTLTFALLGRDNYGREASALVSRYRVLPGGALEALAHERLELDDGTYGTEVWE